MRKTFIARLEAHLKVLHQLRAELRENTVEETADKYFTETNDIINALEEVGLGLLATDVGMMKYKQHNIFATKVKCALEASGCILSSENVIALLSQQKRLGDILRLVDTIIEERVQDYYFYDPKRLLNIQLRGFEQADKELLFMTEEPMGHILNHDIDKLTELLDWER